MNYTDLNLLLGFSFNAYQSRRIFGRFWIFMANYQRAIKIFNVEENKEFMDEVNKGYIPQELVKKGIKNLGIALEDKKYFF